MNTIYKLRRAAAASALLLVGGATHADNVETTMVKAGYASKSIELGVPFGGAIAQHPLNPDLLYVSYGDFASHQVLEVNTDSLTTRSVTPVVGNIGGLAVLNNGDLVITENFDTAVDTILRARDGNSDGDFDDAGEITELISPILNNGDFTGAQLAVAPAGNAAGLPAGSLLVQTADGGTNSELLAIASPETTPEYRPANGAFYTGFTYNGGVAFTAAGHVICGISEFPIGRILALVNGNADEIIDSAETNEIVSGSVLVNSLSDLSVSGDNKMVTSENGGTVRLFDLPSDLMAGTATADILAETNATYLSAARLDFPDRSFGTAGSAPKATVYLGGYVTFPAATNLLAIWPEDNASVSDWEIYE